MVFPIGDDNRDRTLFPIVNVVFIAINVFVFVVLQGAGSNAKFTLAFSTVPAEIEAGGVILLPIATFETLKKEKEIQITESRGVEAH